MAVVARIGQDAAFAASVLRQGGVVAFPTETVYGLGADARQAQAVERVYAIKGRPRNHPLIVHVADPGAVMAWAREVPPLATLLIGAFWPGPLALILPRRLDAPNAAFLDGDSVAVRMPAHPLALALIAQAGGAVAAPSANRFGAISPTSAEHVAADLGDDVDYILDGGPCDVGVESTIVSLLGEIPRILRPGGVTREQVEAVVGEVAVGPAPTEVRAPGLLASHYAPRASLRAVRSGGLEAALAAYGAEARAAGRAPRFGLVVRKSDDVAAALAAIDGTPTALIALDDTPAGFARQLYEALRQLDAAGVELIIACMPEPNGLGAAIADRLGKAAGERT